MAAMSGEKTLKGPDFIPDGYAISAPRPDRRTFQKRRGMQERRNRAPFPRQCMTMGTTTVPSFS